MQRGWTCDRDEEAWIPFFEVLACFFKSVS